MVTVWRPMWALYFLLLAVVQKVLLVWLEWGGWSPNGLQLLGNFWLAVSGLVMLWLAFMWGLTQSMSIRLLAMLHIGFVWLGLAFLIEAVGQFWALLSRSAPWTLGALHATTIGFMGSLMLAMVTRVSCGHGGRKLVADDLTWMLFGLLQLAAKKASFQEMLKKADEVLYYAVKGIADLITVHGLINLDFADVKAVMSNSGLALMGTGIASGEGRAKEAAMRAITSPLLEDVSIEGAKGVLMNITCSPDMTIEEVSEAANIISKEADDNAQIFFGTVFDPDAGDEMRNY
jgi:hypothetical protein